jgi:hypothetical protein
MPLSPLTRTAGRLALVTLAPAAALALCLHRLR